MFQLLVAFREDRKNASTHCVLSYFCLLLENPRFIPRSEDAICMLWGQSLDFHHLSRLESNFFKLKAFHTTLSSNSEHEISYYWHCEKRSTHWCSVLGWVHLTPKASCTTLFSNQVCGHIQKGECQTIAIQKGLTAQVTLNSKTDVFVFGAKKGTCVGYSCFPTKSNNKRLVIIVENKLCNRRPSSDADTHIHRKHE